MAILRRGRPMRTLSVVLALISICALFPGAGAGTIATGSFQVASVGETVSIPIVLDSASGGLSGFRITATLSDPSVATITAAAFPEWASLKSGSAVPAGRIVLQAVDMSQQVPVGATNVLLATLTVKGTATGSTGIAIAVDPSMGVQARNGDQYPVSTPPGTLTVGTPSTGSLPTQLPTSGVPTPVPTAIPTAPPTPGVPTGEEPTPIPTAMVPTPVPTGASPTPIPTPGDSSSVPISSPVYPVTPVATSVPGTVSPSDSSGITTPTVIAPGVRPTFGVGKRYAIGDPGSFIGTRFGSGGTPADTGSRAIVTPEPTLKPGSRAYGLKPPAGRFIRWYPAARWEAGLK